jgi:hypothetical protein
MWRTNFQIGDTDPNVLGDSNPLEVPSCGHSLLPYRSPAELYRKGTLLDNKLAVAPLEQTRRLPALQLRLPARGGKLSSSSAERE